MNKRTFLKSGINGLLGLHFIPKYLLHMMNQMDKYQFSIGEMHCTLFKDFDFNYRIQDYFNNVEMEVALEALHYYNIKKDPIPSPYVGLLIELKDKKILVDTGLGMRKDPLEFMGHQFVIDGRLIPILQKGNLLEDIDTVVVTHLHPDHAGGLFDEMGQCNFGGTEIIVHQAEWEYWTNKYTMGESPVFDYTVREQVMPLQDQNLKLISKQEYEIYPGIHLLKIAGHTPGQLAVHLSSEGEDFLYISDAWLHPLHIQHLDWTTIFDLDHQQAKRTRIRLLEMAYNLDMLVQSFHFDFPGMGRIDKVTNGWKWVAS